MNQITKRRAIAGPGANQKDFTTPLSSPASIPQRRPKKASLRAAIDSKCKACVYDPTNGGTWRQQVELCTCSDCPLYPVRPRSLSRELAREGCKNGLSGDVSGEVWL